MGVNGGSEWKCKLELKLGERGRKKTKSEVQNIIQYSLSLLLLGKTESIHTHTHTDTIPVWCWGLFVCWVMLTECCRCYLPRPVWPSTMPWKKHWWAGFKEPYLLFQHQKVHLGASVIFHLFPQLRLGNIMMSNSLSLSLFHPHPSSPLPSLSLLFHMLHWSFVAFITSLDFHKINISLQSSWCWFGCNCNFMQKMHQLKM